MIADVPTTTELPRALPTIPEFYRGSTIFITGGSGFMGKVLIEKLLRSCPDIHRVYLLLRAKKNKMAAERLCEITDAALFNRIKQENPDVLNKLAVVSGDVKELGLGLSEEDRCMLQDQVSVIFHSAATVRFDEPIKDGVLLNVRGTREVINLALGMKNLKVMQHVSTSYSNCDKPEVMEQIYPAPGDWRKMIEIAERLDDDCILQCLTPKIIGTLPNTYTYTKALAEHLINDHRDRLPLVILRPSIVYFSVEEPMPGWSDNLNGPFAHSVATGMGIISSVYADPTLKGDYVQVDLAIKAMIFIALHRACARDLDTLPVYNCCTMVKPFSYGELDYYGKQVFVETPMEQAFWYPTVTTTTCWPKHFMKVIFFQLIPATIMDVILTRQGKKPMMAKLQRRMYIGNRTLAFFTTRHIKFSNEKFLQLSADIHESDLKDFNYNTPHSQMPLIEYLRIGAKGIREYVMKESESSLPQAKAHMNKLYWLHHTTKTLFYGLLLWTAASSTTLHTTLLAVRDILV